MTCPCGKPAPISNRRSTCARCHHLARKERAIYTRVEKLYQQARKTLRRAA
jgi:hypothetical protein